MMRMTVLLMIVAAGLLAGPAMGEKLDIPALEAELSAAETAFAATMADRDPVAFRGFLSDEVVFFTGDDMRRGPDAVMESWAAYFDGPDAAFSWHPEAVAVIASGVLGFSSGPVLDPDGNRIGTFNSVWRRDADGKWRIIFDRGCPPCGS